jgi:sugar diacid utilization regulator
MLTVQDIPRLDGLGSMVIKAGAENINRAIRWPYIAEDHELDPWLKGGEVIFITGINRQWTDHYFSLLVDVSLRCHVSAIVVLTGSLHIPTLNRTWVAICEQVGMPLIEQPYSLPMVTVTERLSNAIIQDTFSQRSKQWFIQQLIHSSARIPPIALSQADALGLECDTELTIAVLRPNNTTQTANESSIFVMREFLLRHKSPFPVTELNDGWVLIIPSRLLERPSYSEKGIDVWRSIKDELAQHELLVSIGLSDGNTLKEIHLMAYQARQCADFCSGSEQMGIYHYRSFGLQQLFAAVDDKQLKHDFCARYLGSLYQDNDNESMILKNTLRSYFEHLGGLRQTAFALNVHRNTISARLQRFERITGLSMTDSAHRLGIQNALLIESFMLPKHDNP